MAQTSHARATTTFYVLASNWAGCHANNNSDRPSTLFHPDSTATVGVCIADFCLTLELSSTSGAAAIVYGSYFVFRLETSAGLAHPTAVLCNWRILCGRTAEWQVTAAPRGITTAGVAGVFGGLRRRPLADLHAGDFGRALVRASTYFARREYLAEGAWALILSDGIPPL
eukprot:SAG11_NODE_3692_length_2277_cov_1.606979_2_plen_170_part_00